MTNTGVQDFSGKIDGGGYKCSMDNPAAKPKLSLVPGALKRACARALMYGAKKYAPHNWRRGMSFSECLDALERHAELLNDGEMIDEESGLHHFDHIAANLAFLCEFLEREEYASFDDLFKREVSDG